jgi:hypothetical protein
MAGTLHEWSLCVMNDHNWSSLVYIHHKWSMLYGNPHKWSITMFAASSELAYIHAYITDGSCKLGFLKNGTYRLPRLDDNSFQLSFLLCERSQMGPDSRELLQNGQKRMKMVTYSYITF